MVARAQFIMVLASLVGLANVHPASSQDDGSSASRAVAGALLGAYSGGLATTIGSTIWCTETIWGAGCIRAATFVGAGIGGVAGGILGDADSERLKDAAIGSLFGFGVGGAFGILSMQAKSAVKWRDVLMLGAVGGAIGAKPFGAAMGFTAGALTGLVLTPVVPGFGIPEFAATAMAGMAIGILADWLRSASDARSDVDAESDFESLSLAIPIVRVQL